MGFAGVHGECGWGCGPAGSSEPVEPAHAVGSLQSQAAAVAGCLGLLVCSAPLYFMLGETYVHTGCVQCLCID